MRSNMLCTVIKGSSFSEVDTQLNIALKQAHLVELRLDYFKCRNLQYLKQLRKRFPIPMIFTLRSKKEGGHYAHSERDRLQEIFQLLKLKPEFFDLESILSPSFLEQIAFSRTHTKWILSYHHNSYSLINLEECYSSLQKIPADFYKIAVRGTSTLDALKLILWAKEKPKNLICISMGVDGYITRILTPFLQNFLNYAFIKKSSKTALGQLSLKECQEIYHYKKLDSHTLLYGLIGDPVSQSISHITHNHLLEVMGINALYLKMKVKKQELSSFLSLAKELPLQGLSITMPLKEVVLEYLDQIDHTTAKIGAVNTLVSQNNQLIGFNTDGIGALNVIEQYLKVAGKSILIIGAGGAAKAIAYEASQRGAIITILNRDIKKAQLLGTLLNAEFGALDNHQKYLKKGYDILINTTPHPLPIDPEFLCPNTFVMDIKSNPPVTPLLKAALKKNCRIIYGYQMFIEQAIYQFVLWNQAQFSLESMRNILKAKAESIFVSKLKD